MGDQEFIRQISLKPADNDRLAKLCGQFDENLHAIEGHLGVEINNRGNTFEIIGIPASVDIAAKLLQHLYHDTKTTDIGQQQILLQLKSLQNKEDADKTSEPEKLNDTKLILDAKQIQPRTQNQRHYIHSILKHDINFGVGPSGTGKTFLAVACALNALLQEQVKRIVLARPAVEAGESLGFLPGDLAQKIDPYLRPLYDALYEMLGIEKITKLITRGVIEIAPLAYMRGRTLNDSFIILDEAQNSSREQMKMFLTRIGFGSKAVITGDITQTDLPRINDSGLRHAITVLKDVDSIRFCFFQSKDVVRHPLVQAIIEAYDNESE